ncbi:hypothetical protein GCM10028864_11950 [Microlunatus parietis]
MRELLSGAEEQVPGARDRPARGAASREGDESDQPVMDRLASNRRAASSGEPGRAVWIR